MPLPLLLTRIQSKPAARSPYLPVEGERGDGGVVGGVSGCACGTSARLRRAEDGAERR